ncbi:M20/M25/M40 family metallo-hydrolase [Hymenobacter sp. BRD67]|uniref:M20/M25/M40 family metallo-hydrolase n=1 Tax=Hymenobacter sp. BRD67 TaxID=2675877 RepID=UPI001565951D|nr:M20/M25/M40 family metallo-hydrolase [Hymenobacter sp. BRD67]QKG52818.1 M20/M25/M40 family metallo-hydrolase [Hymenobacter sp. BRD67]
MRFTTLFLLLIGWVRLAQAQLPALLQAYARTSAVTGREAEASRFVQSLFKAGTLQQDQLGNLVLVLGSGSPRRLLVAPLDEPGYVVSQIQADGYLRVAPVGGGQAGPLFHQFLEGHDVRIVTAHGARNAISCVPSSHYDNLRAEPEKNKPPFSWQAAFLDVGATSAADVARQGIQLLDPLTLEKKPAVLGQQWVAAPAMKAKAAAIALAGVAQTLAAAPVRGTVVIAWTTLELLNGKGFEAIANRYGPFEEVYRFDRTLETEAAGTGQLLADQALPYSLPSVVLTTPARPARKPVLPNTKLAAAHTYLLGLPARYANTPVEAVAVADVQQLAQAWLLAAGAPATPMVIPALPTAASAPVLSSYPAAAQLLAGLVGQYGVSTAEKPVRDFIARQLPAWARPTVDQAGNLVLTFGQGPRHLVFVAHMDEVGFVVDSIRPNGRLVLSLKGGAYPWLWEAQPALLHTPGQADVPALFEPRPHYQQATKSAPSTPLTVFAGYTSAQQAQAAGVRVGSTTVTMPKQLRPLGPNRAAARGLDDRVGCAALLLTLQHLDPARLPCRVTYVWSTGEEIGLLGSAFAAQQLQDANVVYPIDTFVSSDAPQESRVFGYCPLGQGAVIRVVESINFARRDLVQHVHALADRQHIPIQEGMTAGGTDGMEFMNYGIPSVPLSWPGRYSHSPVEVLDYRDMTSLVRLLGALVQGSPAPKTPAAGAKPNP